MNPLMIHQAMLKPWSYSVTLTTQPMAIWPGRILHILYSQNKLKEQTCAVSFVQIYIIEAMLYTLTLFHLGQQQQKKGRRKYAN